MISAAFGSVTARIQRISGMLGDNWSLFCAGAQAATAQGSGIRLLLKDAGPHLGHFGLGASIGSDCDRSHRNSTAYENMPPSSPIVRDRRGRDHRGNDKPCRAASPSSSRRASFPAINYPSSGLFMSGLSDVSGRRAGAEQGDGMCRRMPTDVRSLYRSRSLSWAAPPSAL